MSREGAKHSYRKTPRGAIALTAGALGLALIGWSLIDLRITTPPQYPSLVSASTSTPSPPTTLPHLDQVEITVDVPVVLYPEQLVEGDEVGSITLPSLDLHWPIVEGTTPEQLERGVGHFQDSVLPGMRDNSVLSGHRTTVFGRLGELKEGDLILIETSAGVFTYEVKAFRIADKSSRDVIVPTPTAVLTLTTCYPFETLLPTTEVYVVTAELIRSEWADHVTSPR